MRSREYLKVRFLDCPKCQTPNSWEVVVRGQTNHDGKDTPETEEIIGFKCHNCGIVNQIKGLDNSQRIQDNK